MNPGKIQKGSLLSPNRFAVAADIPGMKVGGHALSPLVYLHLAKSKGSFAEDARLLQSIVDKVSDRGSLHPHISTPPDFPDFSDFPDFPDFRGFQMCRC